MWGLFEFGTLHVPSYSRGSPNWRLRAGSDDGCAAPTPESWPSGRTGSLRPACLVSGNTVSVPAGIGASSSGVATVAAAAERDRDGRRWRGLGALVVLTPAAGRAGPPTRDCRAARAASCSASCLVAPCPVPSGSAPAKTTDVYSRWLPTRAPSLS